MVCKRTVLLTHTHKSIHESVNECISVTGEPVFAEMMRAHVPRPEAMLFAVKQQLEFGGSSKMDAFLKDFYKQLHQHRIVDAYTV